MVRPPQAILQARLLRRESIKRLFGAQLFFLRRDALNAESNKEERPACTQLGCAEAARTSSNTPMYSCNGPSTHVLQVCTTPS
eukprot:6700352-Alexandrium_andersonii.AAC.1